ncbi:glutamate--cysteine ligase [Bdellovibrionota bacterium FG-2]
MTPHASKTHLFIAQQIQKNRAHLLEWQNALSAKAPPAFYSSVDLRDSGDKIVPVDSNLYPAGFNNICPEDVRTASAIFRQEVLRRLPPSATPHRIVIIPEAHTQNRFYLENLHSLIQIIQEAGFEAKLGWISTPAIIEPLTLTTQTEKTLTAYPIAVQGGVLSVGDFVPDLILLNNDFSGGYPQFLDQIAQPILPSHVLGWHSRKKSEHFRYYNELATEFVQIIKVDPWIVRIESEEVEPVNFNEEIGTEEVFETASKMLKRLETQHQERQISRKPFLFIKNNAGTYGMGIMVIHSAEELQKMNRRTKNKMSVGKNHSQIHSMIIQEGIPTVTLIDRLPAEPVIYLFGSTLIGGFLRTNPERGVDENLNSPGMVFKKLCMSDLREESTDLPALELVYGSIAQLSAFATGMELQAHRKK